MYAEDLNTDPSCPNCGTDVDHAAALEAALNADPLTCDHCTTRFRVESHILFGTERIKEGEG